MFIMAVESFHLRMFIYTTGQVIECIFFIGNGEIKLALCSVFCNILSGTGIIIKRSTMYLFIYNSDLKLFRVYGVAIFAGTRKYQ